MPLPTNYDGPITPEENRRIHALLRERHPELNLPPLPPEDGSVDHVAWHEAMKAAAPAIDIPATIIAGHPDYVHYKDHNTIAEWSNAQEEEPEDPDFSGLVMMSLNDDTALTDTFNATAVAADVSEYPVTINPSFWQNQVFGDGATWWCMSIVENPFGSGRVAKVEQPSQGPIGNPKTSRLENRPTILGMYPLDNSYEVLNLQYELRFSDDYPMTQPWPGQSASAWGCKLPGLSGGPSNTFSPTSCVPVGASDGFTARHMHQSSARLQSYLYWLDKQATCGDNIVFDPVVGPGQWYTIRQRIAMNTPGSFNGSLEVWLDGTKRVDRHDMRWRAAGQNWGINQLRFQTHLGGADWQWGMPSDASPGEKSGKSLYFRNVVLWTGEN